MRVNLFGADADDLLEQLGVKYCNWVVDATVPTGCPRLLRMHSKEVYCPEHMDAWNRVQAQGPLAIAFVKSIRKTRKSNVMLSIRRDPQL